MKRALALQKFLDEYVEEHGISDNVVMGSDHPYTCKCDVCRDWWVTAVQPSRGMGPEEREDGTLSYGPFSQEEIEDYLGGKG